MTFIFGEKELREFKKILGYAALIPRDCIVDYAILGAPEGYKTKAELKGKMAALFKDFDPKRKEDWKIFADNLHNMFTAIEGCNGFKKSEVSASLPFITKFVKENFFEPASGAPLSYFMEAKEADLRNSEDSNIVHVRLKKDYRVAVNGSLKKIKGETQALLERINKQGCGRAYNVTIYNLLGNIRAVEEGSSIARPKEVAFNPQPEIKEISPVGKGKKVPMHSSSVAKKAPTISAPEEIKKSADRSRPLKLGVGVSAGCLSFILGTAAVFYSLKENKNNIKLVYSLSAAAVVFLCSTIYMIGTSLKNPEIQENTPTKSL